MTHCDISTKRCQPCEGGVTPLSEAVISQALTDLSGWTLSAPHIEKTFVFRNHYEAMAFVNAIAWISHREDHHPEVRLGYKDVQVRYWTHAIGGLSENDLICAAKIEKLLTL